jgi:hypothetical protein
VPGRENDYEIRDQQLLRRIQRQLEDAGRTMKDFGLPIPRPDGRTIEERVEAEAIPPLHDDDTGEAVDTTIEERMRRAMEMRTTELNRDQRVFLDKVINKHCQIHGGTKKDHLPNCFLLQGAAGTGKTHTLNAIIEFARSMGIAIRASASTGIAATRLTGASTAHMLFGIPVEKDESKPLKSYLTADSFRGRLVARTTIFIIDEIGMANVKILRAIDAVLRDLKGSSEPFGGALDLHRRRPSNHASREDGRASQS